MKSTHLTSWHFALVLAAVVLFLTDRNNPSASPAEIPAQTWQVYLSPHGGATSAIVRALDQATESIWVQAYSFTSIPIAEALVRAQGRGAAVRVILDRSQKTEKYSAVRFLPKHGIIIGIDAAHAIAHNKVIIIDNEIAISGSFNFTRAAEERNAENLMIIHDRELAARFLDNWWIHQKHSTLFR